MKYLILVLLIFSACTPPVVFDAAYPEGVADLQKIPDAYQGIFMCESDSTLVVINEQTIFAHSYHYFEIPIEYVNSREDCNLDGGEIYIEGKAECIPIEYTDDESVKGYFEERDTIFNRSSTAVVRPYKGHLVFSQKLNSNEWALSILTLEPSGNIMYKAINADSKLDEVERITFLQDITTEKDKNTRYMIRPTKAEFDQILMNEKIFIECEYLIRVNMEELPNYIY